jgi:hypothetical protein
MQIKANNSIMANPSRESPNTESYAIGFLLIPYKRPIKINPIPNAHPPKGKMQIEAANIFIPVRNTINSREQSTGKIKLSKISFLEYVSRIKNLPGSW